MVLGSIAISFLWPPLGEWSRPHLTTILIAVMTLSCLHIDISNMRQIKSHKWQYGLMLLFIFVIPAVIISLFRSFLPAEAYVGLILAAAVPSAVSVVALTTILGGVPAKALVGTTLAHLVSPLLTPLIVWLFAHQVISVDPASMCLLIAKLVVLPLILAQILRALKVHKIITAPLSTAISMGLLVLLITGIISPSRGIVYQNSHLLPIMSAIIVVTLVAEIGLAFVLGKSRREAITWMVVDSYKNFTLSSVIALQLFGPLAVLGSIMFVIIDNLALLPIQFLANHYHNRVKPARAKR